MQKTNYFPILITALYKFRDSICVKLNLLFYVILLFTMTSNSQTPQWEFMGLAGEEMYDIAVDDSGNVFVASWTGIFKSTDNGVSWEFKNNGLQIGDIYKLFIDYVGNIYLCGSANFPGYGLYKSTDGGENWVGFADTLNRNLNNNFEDVTIIPNEPGGIIYVSNEHGVYMSTDNGVSWQSTNYLNPCARNIGINKNGYMFFGNLCASWFGIYRSTDRGKHWVRHTPLSVELSMVYLRDGSILAGCYDPWLAEYGIYKTTDNGDTWFNTNTFSGVVSWDFCLDKNDDIYVSFAGAIFLSTNNGVSWIDYGLTGPAALGIAIDSTGYIWAGAHQNGVYRAAGRTVPVELASFTAEVNNNNVLLSWITATEINNQGFEIERGEITSQDWEMIGFVEGNGTTTEPQVYSFVDKEVLSGKYQYRLKQIDYDGSYEYSKIIEVDVNIPSEFFLSQNYPNPFNPTTKIKFTIQQTDNPLLGGARGGFVSLKVYDILGIEIATLVNEEKPTGNYEVEFDATGLSSGTYFYKIIAGYFLSVKKMLLMK